MPVRAKRLLSLCVFACAVLAAAPARAQSSISLAWDASPDASVTGYTLLFGTRPRDYSSRVDVGNRTTWTVDGLDANQRYYFAVESHDASGVASVPCAEVSNDAIIVRTGAALKDQRPGIFWQHQTTGEILTWHLTGATVVDTRALSIARVADMNWKIVGTGDLNGDGFTDLLWRHQTEGWLAVWYLQGNEVLATRYLDIDRMTDANWVIKGVGDVNGDGYADIVWKHRDGWLAVWLMRGTTTLATQYLSIPRVPNGNWDIAGVTDTDNDGRADLIWRDRTEGWLAVWMLDGVTVTATRMLSIDRLMDPNWQILAAGKVDPTGRPALIWRHATEGWVALWELEGSTVVRTVMLNPDRVADPNWKIVGAR